MCCRINIYCIYTWLAQILTLIKFIRLYYEVWYARDTCLSTPNCSEIFQLKPSFELHCSSAALLSVKSGDYTVVSYGNNIPFLPKVLFFLLYLIDKCSNCTIRNFPAALEKKMLKIVLHKITFKEA